METRRLAMFDFDDTMVKGDSITDFVRYMWEKKLISPPRLGVIMLCTLLWLLRLMPVEKVKNQSLAPLKKLDEGEAAELCKAFVAQRLVPRLFPPALKKMQEHHASGDLVLLVSASPACYLSHIQDFLPVDAVLATPTDQDYRVIVNVRGEEKVRQVKKWLDDQAIIPDWGNSWAYGDSRSDLPVMLLTGNPCLVNASPSVLKAAPHLPRLCWENQE